MIENETQIETGFEEGGGLTEQSFLRRCVLDGLPGKKESQLHENGSDKFQAEETIREKVLR